MTAEPPSPPATEARRALEALIMVSEQPAEPGLLAELLEIPLADVERLLEALARLVRQPCLATNLS